MKKQPTNVVVKPKREAKNLPEKALIGSGRAFVSKYQEVKQNGLKLGEMVGVVRQGEAEKHAKTVNAETKTYSKTEVGQSKIAKMAEKATNVVLEKLPGAVVDASVKSVQKVLSAKPKSKL